MIEFRKEYFADERDDDLHEIGQPTQRQDALGHVTGRSPYYDDHLFDGLLHVRCVRSPHHHARIRRIDTAAAERMPGVVRIVTGRDVPQNLNTLLSLLDFGLDDEPLLSEKKVAYKGEPVAAVIAETDRQAREECEDGVWYFLKNCLKGHLRREGRQLTYGPGVPYIPAAAWREYLKGYQPGRKLLGDVENWEELDASQSIIVGSPETVTRRIQNLIEKAKVGNLLIQFQLGNMPDQLARKSMKLFAEQVAPALRQQSLAQFTREYPGVNVEPAQEAVH